MAKKSINAKSLQQQQTVDPKVAEVIKQANALSAEREKFEQEELARTNKALYAILTKVYALFKQAFDDKCLKDAVKKMQEQLAKRGVKVQKNTPALTVFVRYVFNSDRKRAYNYTSTLMAAIQAEVQPTNLAAFIEGKNGVEECKKEFRKSDERKAKEQALEAATQEVYEHLEIIDAKQTVTLANESVDLSDDVNYAFIVARVMGNGEYGLLRVVPRSSKGMFSTAVKELAKQLVERKEAAITDAKKQTVKKQTKKTVETMTAKAAAAMTVKELEAA